MTDRIPKIPFNKKNRMNVFFFRLILISTGLMFVFLGFATWRAMGWNALSCGYLLIGPICFSLLLLSKQDIGSTLTICNEIIILRRGKVNEIAISSITCMREYNESIVIELDNGTKVEILDIDFESIDQKEYLITLIKNRQA